LISVDLMFSLAGWIWHLDGQVAGRSSGQFPRASPHDYIAAKIERKDQVVNMGAGGWATGRVHLSLAQGVFFRGKPLVAAQHWQYVASATHGARTQRSGTRTRTNQRWLCEPFTLHVLVRVPSLRDCVRVRVPSLRDCEGWVAPATVAV
jgi:hypothetical protein